MKSRITSLILLVFFSFPGIFGEGLHIALPFGVGMSFHHTDGNADSKHSDRTSSGSKTKTVCPVCRLCAQPFQVSVAPSVLGQIDRFEAISLEVIVQYDRSFIASYFLRGPPVLSA